MGVCAGLDPGLALPPGPSSGVSTMVHILNDKLGFAEGDYSELVISRSCPVIFILKPCMERPIAHFPLFSSSAVLAISVHNPIFFEHYGLIVGSSPRTH
jgi:hypothetical protein